MKISADLKNVIGDRGELIVKLRLTDYSAFKRPLFRSGFLGEKWPSIDHYVELCGVKQSTPYFFAQAKATSKPLRKSATNLVISTTKENIEDLLRFPGPTYLFGIHEPSERVFIRSVHAGMPVRAITRIPLVYELTSPNLRLLYDEVRGFWRTTGNKPKESLFK
jgi:hypothetical protein